VNIVADEIFKCLLHFLIIGVENSFPDNQIRLNFYKKYYQILLHRKFPMKETKLILVGPPDSGKTSWFAPFQGKSSYNGLFL